MRGAYETFYTYPKGIEKTRQKRVTKMPKTSQNTMFNHKIMPAQSSDIEAPKRIVDSSILDPATKQKYLKASVFQYAGFGSLK